MKHVWLSIDPGITTGFAVLDDSGEVLATSIWGTGELKDSLDALVRYLFTAGYAIDAVIEKMPSTGGVGPLALKLEQVRQTITSVISGVYEIPTHHIAPGTWKPSRVARTTQLPKKWSGESLTTHQKDAIRMGRYASEARPKFAKPRDYEVGLDKQYTKGA